MALREIRIISGSLGDKLGRSPQFIHLIWLYHWPDLSLRDPVIGLNQAASTTSVQRVLKILRMLNNWF